MVADLEMPKQTLTWTWRTCRQPRTAQ